MPSKNEAEGLYFYGVVIYPTAVYASCDIGYTAVGHTSTDINLGYTAVGYARLMSLLRTQPLGTLAVK